MRLPAPVRSFLQELRLHALLQQAQVRQREREARERLVAEQAVALDQVVVQIALPVQRQIARLVLGHLAVAQARAHEGVQAVALVQELAAARHCGRVCLPESLPCSM